MNKNSFCAKSEDKVLNLGFLNAKAVEATLLPLNEAEFDTLSNNSFDSCKRQLNSAENLSYQGKRSSINCQINPILVDLKDGIFLNLNIDLNISMNLKQNEKVNLNSFFFIF